MDLAYIWYGYEVILILIYTCSILNGHDYNLCIKYLFVNTSPSIDRIMTESNDVLKSTYLMIIAL